MGGLAALVPGRPGPKGGHKLTAEVITYRGRSAVRDVGKVLGLGLDLLDEMAKRLGIGKP